MSLDIEFYTPRKTCDCDIVRGSFNLKSSLRGAAIECGAEPFLWGLFFESDKKVFDIILPLMAACEKLKQNPRLKKGTPSYVAFLSILQEIISVCISHPSADIFVSL